MIRSTISFLNLVDYVMAFLSGEFEIIKSNRECDGLGFVRFTRGLGRKRILISNSDLAPANDSSSPEESNRSLLESLHQDILIKVLCHVDHEDLSTLKRVSKTIRKAVIEAKKSHFDFSTPTKRLPFRDAILSDSNLNSNSSKQDDEIEPPNAPIQRRNINREIDLSKISMVLFK